MKHEKLPLLLVSRICRLLLRYVCVTVYANCSNKTRTFSAKSRQNATQHRAGSLHDVEKAYNL